MVQGGQEGEESKAVESGAPPYAAPQPQSETG